jgi:hypothetical protein
MHAITCYGLITRRRRRALFLTSSTQQVRSAPVLRELARGVAAVGAVIVWGALLLLVAG